MKITIRRIEGIWEASINFDDGRAPMHQFSLSMEGLVAELMDVFGGEICLKTA